MPIKRQIERLKTFAMFPLEFLRLLRWVLLGVFILSVLLLIRGIVAAAFAPASASASSHPLAALCWLVGTAMLTFFAFYVYRHGGIKSVWGGPKDLSQRTDDAGGEPESVSLSFSEIKESLPEDKWIVATVKGALSASVCEKRRGIASRLLGDIEYKLRRPINVLYNYYVELSDPRFSAVFDRRDGKLQISVPALKFDDEGIRLKDLTEFDITTDNSEFFIPASLKRDMPARLKAVLQENYKFSGRSSVNLRLAMLDAQKSIRNHVENLLWQKGGYLREDSLVDFKWLATPPGITDSRTDIEVQVLPADARENVSREPETGAEDGILRP